MRAQVCSGCWRVCQYRYFRGAVPTPERKEARSHTSSGARRDFQQMADDKAREVTENISRGVGDRLTKAKILGQMHEEKRDEWIKATEECFLRGQKLPETVDEALRWVARLGAERFRKEVQGWSDNRWKRTTHIKRAVSVDTFLRWWDRARQRELGDDLDRPNLLAPGRGLKEDTW